MCGRFLLAIDPADLQDSFPQFKFNIPINQRFNIAPTQPVLVVPNDSSFTADYYTWGLIPSWAKDPSIGSRMINARAETLSEKPSFRGPFKHHRCLILSNGFYEWQKRPGSNAKKPFYIRLKTGKPFAFAGLWDEWHSPDGSQIKSCTIITTIPNSLVAPIHDRMPVILPIDKYSIWLDPSSQSSTTFQDLLQSYPADEMIASPVSSYVNNPANNGPDCLTGTEF
ncbi:MAG: SOS response-associated peptidase [Chloroflexota bacterium]